MSNKNVTKKVLNVLKKVNKVQKSGFNKHQNYHYSTESDLIDAVRPHLLTEGLILTSSVEEVSTTDTLTKVKMKHQIIDSESGEILEMYSQGFGNLSVGKDKSVFAAQTGSFKYFISKNFMIASDDDPENDEFEDKKDKSASPQAPKLGFNRSAAAALEATKPPVEEPKEELIKPPPAAAPVVAKTSFPRRTLTNNSNKDPNF